MARDCDSYQEKLSAYLDGQLPPDEGKLISAHLETCPECASLLERMKKLGRMASEAMLDIDDSVLDTLERRITDRLDQLPESSGEGKPAGGKITPIWHRYAALAATVVLVFSVGYFALDESNRPLWETPPSQAPSPVPMKSAEPREQLEAVPGEVLDELGGVSDTKDQIEESEPGQKTEIADDEVDAIPQVEIRESEESPAMTPPASKRDINVAISAEDYVPADQQIAGKVIDAKTGEGVAGASVLIEGTTKGARTDNDGRYVIPSVPPDTYRLKISRLSYDPAVVDDVVVEPGKTSEHDARLQASTIEAGKVTAVSGRQKKTDITQTGTDALQPSGEIQYDPDEEAVSTHDAEKKADAFRPDEEVVKDLDAALGAKYKEAGKSTAMLRIAVADDEMVSLADIYASAVAEYQPPKKRQRKPDSLETTDKDSLAVYWFVVFERRVDVAGKDDIDGQLMKYYIAARGHYDLYRQTGEDNFFFRAEDMREAAIKIAENHLRDHPDDSLVQRRLDELNGWRPEK